MRRSKRQSEAEWRRRFEAAGYTHPTDQEWHQRLSEAPEVYDDLSRVLDGEPLTSIAIDRKRRREAG